MALEDAYVLAGMPEEVRKRSRDRPRQIRERPHGSGRQTVVRASAETRKRAFDPALADADGVTAYLAREWEQGPVMARYDKVYAYDATRSRSDRPLTQASERPESAWANRAAIRRRKSTDTSISQITDRGQPSDKVHFMLELYHNDMSTCAQKVRFALAEKGEKWQSHHLDLRARDHQRPEYLRAQSQCSGADHRS